MISHHIIKDISKKANHIMKDILHKQISIFKIMHAGDNQYFT